MKNEVEQLVQQIQAILDRSNGCIDVSVHAELSERVEALKRQIEQESAAASHVAIAEKALLLFAVTLEVTTNVVSLLEMIGTRGQ